MTKISISLLVAGLLVSAPAFARHSTWAEHEQAMNQARVDIADARCVMNEREPQCLPWAK